MDIWEARISCLGSTEKRLFITVWNALMDVLRCFGWICWRACLGRGDRACPCEAPVELSHKRPRGVQSFEGGDSFFAQVHRRVLLAASRHSDNVGEVSKVREPLHGEFESFTPHRRWARHLPVIAAVHTLVERFDIEPFSDFLAKWANFRELVLFCIDAKFCNKIFVGKLLTRSKRFTCFCTVQTSVFQQKIFSIFLYFQH